LRSRRVFPTRGIGLKGEAGLYKFDVEKPENEFF
jgi:hypothetical protein